MKKCSRCGTVYTDTTLAFCLTDGTPLTDERTQAETVILPDFGAGNETQASFAPETNSIIRDTGENIIQTGQRQRGSDGVSRIWVFSTIGLIGIIIAGVFAALFFMSGPASLSNRNEDIPANEAEALGTGSIHKQAENIYRIVGVKSNDVLFMRPAPGNLKIVVGKIPPNATGIKIIGAGKRSGKSIWVPIEFEGMRGWVNRGFLAKQ